MAAEACRGGGESDTWILQELEALRRSLLAPRTQAAARRTASLTLVRSQVPPLFSAEADWDEEETVNLRRSRSRRPSLSSLQRPWLKFGSGEKEPNKATAEQEGNRKWDERPSGKKGIWSWKPIRALMHVGMQKLSCVFSVRVAAVQNLPDTLDGLLLSVCVRKNESKDGLVQTMPCRVVKGAAEIDETLFMRCHVYFSPGSGARMKFESRPFSIYAVAVGDARGLDFGQFSVDLCGLIQESIESSLTGTRIPQWDRSFTLSGKARGGKLVLTLGFQIMEKDEGRQKYCKSILIHSASVARRQSRSSFSIPNSRKLRGSEAWTHAEGGPPNPNESDNPWATASSEDDILDFNVVDKGVEIPGKAGEEEEKNSVSSHEVVKKVVQDKSSRLAQLKEIDLIAQQMKEPAGAPALDAEEDEITKEFLEMLEGLQGKVHKINCIENEKLKNGRHEEQVYVADLGKGLGCIVQTRNGGYLAAANPCKMSTTTTKDMVKLAVQTSKPCIMQSNKAGFELFQKMASIGLKELTSAISSLMPMDELMGKTIEQIAFEGIASAVTTRRRRNKDGANSSAARAIAAVKSMASAMNNTSEDPLTMDEILAYSMHKLEEMAVNALKVQADIGSDDAPFDVSPLNAKTIAANVKAYAHPLASAIPVEDWINDDSANTESMIISVVIQLRDPSRRYEAIGGPMIALINATSVTKKATRGCAAEKRYKVLSLQVGGIKVRTARTKNGWDREQQRVAALTWLLANGIGKAGKTEKAVDSKGEDVLWSISSRVKSDTWLKAVRNPDVKFAK